MPFDVPPLAYELAAFEPYVSEATMRLNRERHHAYVEKLNRVIQGTAHEHSTAEEILSNLDALTPEQQLFIRPNCGGHHNHVLFWESLSPEGGEPEGELARAIEQTFGSLEELKSQMTQRAWDRFSPGWAWLVSGSEGLKTVAIRSEDSPLSRRLTPLLGIDVWEHAFLLTYGLDKGAYVDALWNVINWATVAERYAALVPAVAGSNS